MSKNFEMAFERTLRFEGGYSDDPVDRGGKTKYGVTEDVWHEFCGGQIPCKVSEITVDQAKAVYWKLYWLRGGLERLDAGGVPSDLLNEIFDCCVNCGVHGAGEIIQKAYNWVRQEEASQLLVDGIVGPRTQAALVGFCSAGRDYCDALLAMLRFQHGRKYLDIVASDASQRKFIRGWFRRLV